jgi:hypothetical protein
LPHGRRPQSTIECKRGLVSLVHLQEKSVGAAFPQGGDRLLQERAGEPQPAAGRHHADRQQLRFVRRAPRDQKARGQRFGIAGEAQETERARSGDEGGHRLLVPGAVETGRMQTRQKRGIRHCRLRDRDFRRHQRRSTAAAWGFASGGRK